MEKPVQEVTVAYDAFKSESVSTTIPFELCYGSTFDSYTTNTKASGSAFVFAGKRDNTVTERANAGVSNKQEYVTGLYVEVTSENWGKALAGDYKATITFTAEVVVEE